MISAIKAPRIHLLSELNSIESKEENKEKNMQNPAKIKRNQMRFRNGHGHISTVKIN